MYRAFRKLHIASQAAFHPISQDQQRGTSENVATRMGCGAIKTAVSDCQPTNGAHLKDLASLDTNKDTWTDYVKDLYNDAWDQQFDVQYNNEGPPILWSEVTGHYVYLTCFSTDCQGATDEHLIDFATQDHNEAVSELEATCEGEFELSLHQRNDCYKKDRHREFIPIRQFSIDKLDPPYKDQEIVEVVKQMAALTVLVRVRKISSLRPPYPYPPEKRVNVNGRQCLITGSGFVMAAFVYRQESGKPCPCSECKESASPRSSWGKVLIATAGHVVFDSFEAEQTTCYFDFDGDDTDIHSIPSLTCSKDFSPMCDTTCDMINLFCYTHDVDFAEKLRNMVAECIIHRSILTRKYFGSSDTPVLDPSYFHKATDYAYFINANIESTEMNYECLSHLVGELNTQVQQNYPRPNIPNGESSTEILQGSLDHIIGYVNTVVQKDNPPLPSILQPKGNLVIVVSHPHGCGKYVSLGEYTSRPVMPNDVDTHEIFTEKHATFYVYTAQTCPGSSGGPVFVLSKENVGIATHWVHSKFLKKLKLSRCGVGLC